MSNIEHTNSANSTQVNNRDTSYLYHTEIEIKNILTKINIDDFLQKISLIINEYKTISEKYPTTQYLHMFHKIGHLISTEFSNIMFFSNDIKNNINQVIDNGGNFEFGENSFLAPGSLSSIGKLIEYNIVDARNVDISILDNSNIQEGIRFVKKENEYGYIFFNKLDIINNIKITLGNSSTIAHGTVFVPEQDNNYYEFKLDIKDNVFIGINSRLGNNVSIGNDSAIWWGNNIGNNINIGENVTIGAGVIIQDNIDIPDNSLILNGSVIKKGYKIIEYDKYIQNESYYDTNLINEGNRRDFIIQLPKIIDADHKNNLINKINSDYSFISNFNTNHVIPENILFNIINIILFLIKEKYPSINIEEQFIFDSEMSKTKTNILKRFIDKNIIDNEIEKKSKLIIKAFPKNKEKFLVDIIPLLLKHPTETNIEPIIEQYLEYPNIPKNKEQVFLGTNILVGNVNITEDNIIFDSFFRSDELSEDNVLSIDKSVIAKSIFHGNNDKIISESIIISTVIHGKTSVIKSYIGNYHQHSVFHNCIIKNSTGSKGGIIANGVNIIDTILLENIILSPFRNFTNDIISIDNNDIFYNINNSKIGSFSIIGNSIIKNSTIDDKSYIGNGIVLEGQIIRGHLFNKNKHELESHILY